MAESAPAPFWVKVIAAITGCAAIGALAGVGVGALTVGAGRGLAVGTGAGALVAVVLVVLLGERLRE